MQIIWDQTVAERLQNTHTILELETFDVEGKQLTAYCVVPVDKIPLSEFPQLANQKELHSAFVQAFRDKNYKLCRDIAEHLEGKFGGDLDSFYEEILKRIPMTF